VTAPVVRADRLSLSFDRAGTRVQAVCGVDLELRTGETLAIVGESGSGKTSLALALLGAHRPQSGRLLFREHDVWADPRRELPALRRAIQMVLQDPYSSLDPRWRVGDIVAEPLLAQGLATRAEARARVGALLERVGLTADATARMPSQFSGGQRQRIAIARALVIEPEVVVADEPVSALDVSIQAQIVNLLLDLQRESGLGYAIISHDLALVGQIADRVVVMYLGRIVEEGAAANLIGAPAHPSTAALVSAVPEIDASTARQRIVLRGEPPSPIAPPPGCPFHPRCPVARPRCALEEPLLEATGDGRRIACWYPLKQSEPATGHRLPAREGRQTP
jgi:peptide/nickel transport system ATP-binding protein